MDWCETWVHTDGVVMGFTHFKGIGPARDMMLVGTHGHGLGWLSLLSDFKYPVLS